MLRVQERDANERNRIARAIVAVAVLAAAGIVALTMGGTASAETVEIPLQDSVVIADPGSVNEIGSATVAAELVGRTCNVVATVTNQGSVHTGNKLIVTSGDSRVEIAAIEDVAGGVTVEGGSLTLGDTIVVSVELGADGITSLGSSLTLTCEALPPAPPPPTVVTTPKYTG